MNEYQFLCTVLVTKGARHRILLAREQANVLPESCVLCVLVSREWGVPRALVSASRSTPTGGSVQCIVHFKLFHLRTYCS